jgi:putative membrane protein
MEIVLVREGMNQDTVRKLTRIDIWYGALAGAIIVVGFSRAIFAAKGWAYYSHNGFFWAKIATFVIIAILSIPPTLEYIKWQRAGAAPSTQGIARMQIFLYSEAFLFAFLLAFAAAMARGYGEF